MVLSTPSASRRRSSATRVDTSEAATGAASWSSSSIARSIGANHGLGPRSTSPRSAAGALEPAAPELVLGAGQGHIEQAAFLFDRSRRLGRGQRHQPAAQPEHEHGLPLEALGPVERGEHHVVAGYRFGHLVVVQVDATAASPRQDSAPALGAPARAPRWEPSPRRSLAGPRSAPATAAGTPAASMAASTVVSCALVRVEHRDGRPGPSGRPRQLDLPGRPGCFVFIGGMRHHLGAPARRPGTSVAAPPRWPRRRRHRAAPRSRPPRPGVCSDGSRRAG